LGKKFSAGMLKEFNFTMKFSMYISLSSHPHNLMRKIEAWLDQSSLVYLR